jgi:hypothetical protein
MTLPTNIIVDFFDTPPRIAPKVKSTSAKISIGLRPKSLEPAMKTGCQTQEARRKVVPIQRDSMLVLCIAADMTGRATDTVVASSAHAKLTIAIEPQAALRRHPGLKASILVFVFSDILI